MEVELFMFCRKGQKHSRNKQPDPRGRNVKPEGHAKNKQKPLILEQNGLNSTVKVRD
jgi:hypothetical protein